MGQGLQEELFDLYGGKMTRKHFVAIAQALPKDTDAKVLEDLCRVFKDINPRFDSTKFIDAVRNK